MDADKKSNMNNKAVLFHLREAKEELDRTIAELETVPDYRVGHFLVAMRHLYHHVNTAWNGRNATAKAHQECAQHDFEAWRKFPQNADLLLE